MPAEDVAAFVAVNLSPERFREYLADDDRYLVLVAELDGILAGYTLAVLPRAADEPPHAPDVAAVVSARPVAELSKIYVRATAHGSGISQALMDATLAALSGRTVQGRPWPPCGSGPTRATGGHGRSTRAPAGSTPARAASRSADVSKTTRSTSARWWKAAPDLWQTGPAPSSTSGSRSAGGDRSCAAPIRFPGGPSAPTRA